MSLQFSDSTNKDGIVELIDANVSTNSTSYPLKDKTRDINIALDRFLSLAINSSGTWQFDDSNHTDYPIITTDLVAGQRDYSFLSDNSGNLILDIFKVMAKDEAGIYRDLKQVDVNSENNVESFTDGQDTQGIPTRYDKLSNGIFLDPIPSYNSTNGLKMYVNRETTYFTTSDTTKKAGIPGIYHSYLAFYPSYQYAVRNNLHNLVSLRDYVDKMEKEIKDYFGKRQKDKKKVIRASHLSKQNYI